MMPGDDKSHEYAMDAADARADQKYDAALEWVRSNGWSASIVKAATGDENAYHPELDGFIKRTFTQDHKDLLELFLVNEILLDEEWVEGLTFGD